MAITAALPPIGADDLDPAGPGWPSWSWRCGGACWDVVLKTEVEDYPAKNVVRHVWSLTQQRTHLP
jgi:hypothetical protein